MYIGSAAMPVLFVNGTNDFAYPLDSYAKTYDLVQGRRNLRITVNMPHGHPEGWAPAEIGLFVDEHLRGGRPLPKDPAAPEPSTARLSPTCGPRRIWSRPTALHDRDRPDQQAAVADSPGRIEGSRIVAKAPPQEATIWFLTVTDERGAVVSSELVFGSQR